jgi:hypothetical protein
MVHDVSGVDTPLDLKVEKLVENLEPVTWLANGLRINVPVIIKANGPATRLLEALKASNAITIEAWIKRAAHVADDQSPGRIVTFSRNFTERNFTLGQSSGDRYEVRLRTTATDDNGVNRRDSNQRVAQEVAVAPDLCHVVYTRDAAGQVRLYLNGADPIGSNRPQIGGTFANWDGSFQLALANELIGNRPWLGEYYLIAIYNRALSEPEVRQNWAAKF